jgi:hypothetical protein
MPTAPYKNKAGVRIPSVTTILGRFKESGGLLYWAWNCGRDGISMDSVKEKACTAGTITHQWIEDDLHGKELTVYKDVVPDTYKQAENAYEQFKAWRKGFNVNVTHTEVSLVSEKYQFGGTLDGAAMDGKRIILDWKTSKSIYSDYLVQCAAYALLWEENYGEEIDEAHILRIDKENADFEHRRFAGLSKAKELFRLYAAAYPLAKEIDKRVK